MIQNIAIFKFFLHCILLSLMFEIPFKHNWYLNIHPDRKNNSPPIVHLRLSKDVKGDSKYKKEKWQCSQNVDLNPTYAQDYKLVIEPIHNISF